jgi:hypothetical protein
LRAPLFLLLIALFLIPSSAYAIDFNVTGYLRSRIVSYSNLDTQVPNPNVNQGGLGDNDRIGNVLFVQERFRIEPILKLNDNITIQATIDVPDNIIAGTQGVKTLDFQSPIVGTIQLPGAGGAIGTSGGEAGENKILNVRRVFMDLLTPIGKFRIGRQGSMVGLGIFQNDGDGYNDDFGISADRIMYLASVETQKAGIFNFGAAVDFTFTKQTDPRISGLAGEFPDGPENDLHQYAGFLFYEKDNFSIGTFSGLRYRAGTPGNTTTTARQILVDGAGNPILDSNDNLQLGALQPAGHDGDTSLLFGDFYTEFKRGPYRFRGEYVVIGGKISTGVALNAIPFNSLPSSAFGPIEMPAQSDMLAQMAAVEFDGVYNFGEFHFQGGYASGDSQPLSSKITQFGFQPDYQIALLLFHAPLGSSPRITQPNGNGVGSRQLVGGVPITGNNVNNAIYTTIGYWHHFDMTNLVPKSSDTKLGLKFITAWAPASNFDINFAEITGFADLPRVESTGKWYGYELDANFQSRFWDHFLFDLTAGYLNPGSAYDVNVNVFNPVSSAQINVIPFDGSDWAWGIRTNLIAQF